jgi:DNA-binding transcriptional MocR family regulator
MQNWTRFRAAAAPKYLSIAGDIEEAIRSNALSAGDRLPTQRELADLLDVDLTTVTRAYAILRDARLIEGQGRLGSFVRNDALAPKPGETVSDAGMNMPPQPGFALLADAIRSGTDRLLRASGQSPLLQYQPGSGNLHDRRAAAAAFGKRGMTAHEDQIVLTAGGQNALHAIFRTLFQTGDAICAGRHCYPGMMAIASRMGLRIVPIDADRDGLDPDQLERALKRGARAVYIVPTNDNPTTLTTTLERKHTLADVVQRCGSVIVEDDAYGCLPTEPIKTLCAIAPDVTWHISSVSKIISPALRIAHVRVPLPSDAKRVSIDIHETAIMAPPLSAALVTRWLEDGTFAEIVAGVRRESVARQKIVRRSFEGTHYESHPEGYHMWLQTKSADQVLRIIHAATPFGLSVVPAQAFASGPRMDNNAVRISIGGALTHSRLSRAIGDIAQSLDM